MGVDSSMEYRTVTVADYDRCSENEINNLKPGIYYVRYREDSNYNSGKERQIIIGEGRLLSVKFSTPYVTLKEVDVSVSYAEKISKPHISEVPGYSFVGWYKDAEFTTVWDFEKDKVCEDIVCKMESG